MKKILAIDAVGCLVDLKGNINNNIYKLINKYDNKKIILTNANDEEKKIFLKNISDEIFSLKHNPEKTNPIYYQKFLSKFKIKAENVIYLEHNIKAVESAKLNNIVTHHYDGNIDNLNQFLKKNLE